MRDRGVMPTYVSKLAVILQNVFNFVTKITTQGAGDVIQAG